MEWVYAKIGGIKYEVFKFNIVDDDTIVIDWNGYINDIQNISDVDKFL